MEKSMLLFWPWFVECAFQQQYYKTTLGLCDSVCMPLDILIWLIDIVLMLVAGRWWAPLELACTVPPFVAAVACLLYRRRNPDKYRRKRSSTTACRRLASLPFLSWVLLRRQPQAIGSWPAALMHLLVLSGGVHTLIVSGLFLNSWGVAVLESLASSLMLGSAAPHSCSNILAGPQPHAGWKAAAAVMEKASLGMYSSSVQDPHLEHAVCCTTLNTVLVSSSHCCSLNSVCLPAAGAMPADAVSATKAPPSTATDHTQLLCASSQAIVYVTCKAYMLKTSFLYPQLHHAASWSGTQ
jgi:hypothetical protein